MIALETRYDFVVIDQLAPIGLFNAAFYGFKKTLIVFDQAEVGVSNS